MCRRQTTKRSFSFICNATATVESHRVVLLRRWGKRTALSFTSLFQGRLPRRDSNILNGFFWVFLKKLFMSYHVWNGVQDLYCEFIWKTLKSISYQNRRLSSEMPPVTLQTQRGAGFSFPHGYARNEARKLDSRRQPLSVPHDMPQTPLKESFREARNVPDYFSLFQPHPSVWNITVFCMESNYFSLKPQELCQQLSVQRAV